MDIRTNCKIVKVDQDFEPRVQLADGEWVEGDVIIAADGIKSTIRKQMTERRGGKDRSLPTGDAAYRILIPREKLLHDARALKLLDTNMGVRWLGPGGHVSFQYPNARQSDQLNAD